MQIHFLKFRWVLGPVKAEEGRHLKMCDKHFNLAWPGSPTVSVGGTKGHRAGGTGGAGSLNALRTH